MLIVPLHIHMKQKMSRHVMFTRSCHNGEQVAYQLFANLQMEVCHHLW